LGSDGNLKKVLVANGAGSVVAYGTYQDTLPTSSVSGNNFGLTTDGSIIDFRSLVEAGAERISDVISRGARAISEEKLKNVVYLLHPGPAEAVRLGQSGKEYANA
jgi:hypothetical protein